MEFSILLKSIVLFFKSLLCKWCGSDDFLFLFSLLQSIFTLKHKSIKDLSFLLCIVWIPVRSEIFPGTQTWLVWCWRVDGNLRSAVWWWWSCVWFYLDYSNIGSGAQPTIFSGVWENLLAYPNHYIFITVEPTFQFYRQRSHTSTFSTELICSHKNDTSLLRVANGGTNYKLYVVRGCHKASSSHQQLLDGTDRMYPGYCIIL